MFIQIGYQELVDISSFHSFEDLIEELNDLLGENCYIIENNGKKIDLSGQYQLSNDETYKIWPKVLGGKVRI
jgi:GTP-sensing pleiotropic transcriptional regulator CodY